MLAPEDLEAILGSSEKNLIPVKNRISVPINSEEIMNESLSALMMGRFYEFITAAFYGGILDQQSEVYVDGEKKLFKPDVVDKENNTVRESKACVIGSRAILLDSQIESYKSLQTEVPHPQIYFHIYRHIHKGIKSSWKGTPEELVRELSKETIYSLVLPLSIILQLHSGSPEIVYRYENNTEYDKGSYVKTNVIEDIMKNPLPFLSRIKLNPNEYQVEKKLSPRFLINGLKLKQFPILEIKDRNHVKWAADFTQMNINDVPF